VVEVFTQSYMTGGSSCLLLAQIDLVMQRPVVVVSTGLGHLISKWSCSSVWGCFTLRVDCTARSCVYAVQLYWAWLTSKVQNKHMRSFTCFVCFSCCSPVVCIHESDAGQLASSAVVWQSVTPPCGIYMSAWHTWVLCSPVLQALCVCVSLASSHSYCGCVSLANSHSSLRLRESSIAHN